MKTIIAAVLALTVACGAFVVVRPWEHRSPSMPIEQNFLIAADVVEAVLNGSGATFNGNPPFMLVTTDGKAEMGGGVTVSTTIDGDWTYRFADWATDYLRLNGTTSYIVHDIVPSLPPNTIVFGTITMQE